MAAHRDPQSRHAVRLNAAVTQVPLLPYDVAVLDVTIDLNDSPMGRCLERKPPCRCKEAQPL